LNMVQSSWYFESASSQVSMMMVSFGVGYRTFSYGLYVYVYRPS